MFAPILAKLANLGVLGLIARDADGSVQARSLAAPAAGFTITNPAGTAGDPTFVLANDLLALEALASTGFAVRSATDTWVQRTLTGTTNRIGVTNGDGVAGNPTLDVGADVWLRTGATVATANFDLGGFRITNLAASVNDNDAVRRAELFAVGAGLRNKESVRVATAAALPAYTRAGNVITASAVGVLTVDGVATVLNDRILVKDGAAGADNGPYYVSTEGTALVAYVLTRTTDADVSAEVKGGLTVWVNEGTTNLDSSWTLITNDPITLNTTALSFTQTSGLGQVSAGAGLTKTGSTLDVGAGNGIQVNADSVEAIYGVVGEMVGLGTEAAGTLNKAARVDHVHANVPDTDGGAFGSSASSWDLYGRKVQQRGVTAAKTASYTILGTEGQVSFDGASLTGTLPDLATNRGLWVPISNDNATNALTVARAGTDTIQGDASFTLAAKGNASFYAPQYGTAWRVF